MADNSKSSSAPGGVSEDSGTVEAPDDEDQGSENTDCVEETIFQQMVLEAPPENQWYHGRLDRRTAEQRLNGYGQTGGYLVREIETEPGSYVLCYFGKTGINHFKITAMAGDFYIGGRRFDSLSVLIGYYTHVSYLLIGYYTNVSYLLIGYYTNVSYLLKGEQLMTPIPPPEFL